MATYLLVRDCTTAPDTRIRVGHIISDRANATSTLNADSYVPLSSAVVDKFTQTGFHATRSQLRSSNFGLWAKILENASASIGADGSHNTEDIFTIEKLETESMWLGRKEAKEYIRNVPNDEAVKEFLDGCRYKKPVYLISGVKIARGAKTISEVDNRDKSGSASASLDGAPIGVPASIGAKLEGKSVRIGETKIGGGDDFVFAYQLRKLVCSKKNKPVKDEASSEGALFEAGGGKEEKEEQVEVEMEEDDMMDVVKSDEAEMFHIPGDGEGKDEVCIMFKDEEW